MSTELNALTAAAVAHAENEARIWSRLRDIEERRRTNTAWSHEFSVDLNFRSTARLILAQAYVKVVHCGRWQDTLEGARIAWEAALDATDCRSLATFVRVSPSMEPNPVVTIPWIIEETVEAGFSYTKTSFADRSIHLARILVLGVEAERFAYHAYQANI
jgi:hypothetical protein